MLIRKYGLNSSLELKLIAKRSNRNVYKVQTNGKSYALKEYNRTIAIDYHAAIFNQIDENGFHLSPKIISTLDGSSSVKIKDTTYVLSEWIEGVEPSFLNIKHLKAASALLASFHRAAIAPDKAIIKSAPNAFLHSSKFSDIKVGQNKMSTISEKLRIWAKQFGTDPLNVALERMEYVEQSFPNDSYTELFTSERQKNAFNHGDFNSGNLILTPDRKLFLIDYDGSAYSVRISDLLFLCHLHTGNDTTVLLEILKSYHQVRPLSLTEFEVVKSLLLVPGNVYWEMHIMTYFNKPIDSDWINKNLKRYSGNDFYDNIKKLSLADLQ